MHGIKGLLLDRNVLVADIPAYRDQPALVSLLPGVDLGLPRLLAAYRCMAFGGEGRGSLANLLSQAKLSLPIWDERGVLHERFEKGYYEQAAGALGLPPEEICVITGSYQDVLMPAVLSGMKGILLTTQMGRFPEAELIVPTFAQLLMFIET